MVPATGRPSVFLGTAKPENSGAVDPDFEVYLQRLRQDERPPKLPPFRNIWDVLVSIARRGIEEYRAERREQFRRKAER
jgi:hypothetical protein